jgi:hypothetical protein
MVEVISFFLHVFSFYPNICHQGGKNSTNNLLYLGFLLSFYWTSQGNYNLILDREYFERLLKYDIMAKVYG